MTTRCLLFVSVSFFCVVSRAAADDWKLVGKEQGLEVYRRDVPGSNVVALKGEGTIDAPIWKVASILLDTRRAPEWVDSLKESRVLRRLGFTSYIEYNHIGLPFIIKDRDFVSEVSIEVDPAAKTFALLYKPTDDPSAPATHHVRGEIISGAFRAKSLAASGQTQLAAEVHCNPKGAVPAWIVNLFQKNWPRRTFQSIRTQAAKPDVAMPDEFRDVLEPTRQF